MSYIERFRFHPLLPWLGAAACALHFRFEPRLAVCAGAVLFLVLRYWRRCALKCPRTPSDHVPGRVMVLTLELIFAWSLGADVLNLFLPKSSRTALPELPAAPPAAIAAEPNLLNFIAGVVLVVFAFIVIVAFTLLVASLPALLVRAVVFTYDAYASAGLTEPGEPVVAKRLGGSAE